MKKIDKEIERKLKEWDAIRIPIKKYLETKNKSIKITCYPNY